MTATNTFGGAGLLSRHSSVISTFYTFDERGNVAQRLDSTGTPTSSATYDSYGVSVSAQPDPFGFGGQFGYYTVSETGLQLCQHRYYDSSTGRFVNRDPIGYGGGLNLYAYCANNSVNRADPGGFNPFKVHPTTDAGYMSPVRSYLIDIPAGFDVLAVASKFGQDAKSTPPIILFFRENNNVLKPTSR